LDRDVTNEQIEEVARVARDKWRQIATHLGSRYSELQEYENLHKTLYDRLYAVLSDWTMKVEHPKARVLLEACRKADVGGSVGKILGIQCQ
jgi:hypothetical protein